MDVATLQNEVNDIRKQLPQVYSTIVYKNGEKLISDIKPGYVNKNRTIRSLTKSIVSSLIGILLDKGYIKNLDESAIKYFPDYRGYRDDHLSEVTIRHLLTMSSGFDCTDKSPKGFFKSKNWIDFTLGRKIVSCPGERFAYSSMGSHILAAIICKASGLNAFDFGKKYLFAPLGIHNINWRFDKQGYYMGGFGIDMTPDDLAKIGLLYLNEGDWENRQIIPTEYIKEATSSKITGGFPEQSNYGYHWWVETNKDNSTRFYYAAGMGGQYIFVVPSHRVVTVITSESRRHHPNNKKIFTEVILPILGTQSEFTL